MRKPSSIQEYESQRDSEALLRSPLASPLGRSADRMKTGDIIAFSGTKCISRLNRWVTHSRYSHVAMVFEAELGGGFGKSVLIIESAAPQTQRDPYGRKVILGVQIHWLSRRLDMYQGKAWWLPLKHPIAPDKLVEMQAWLRQTYNQRRRFDIVQVVVAGVGFLKRLGFGHTDLSALYCAELVTAALQIAGVVDPSINPSMQTPADVVNFPCFVKPPIMLKP